MTKAQIAELVTKVTTSIKNRFDLENISAGGTVYNILARTWNTGLTETEVNTIIDSKISSVQPVFQPVQNVYIPIAGDRPKVTGDYNSSEFVSGVNTAKYLAFAVEGNLAFYVTTTNTTDDTLVVAELDTGVILQSIVIDSSYVFTGFDASPYNARNIVGVCCGVSGTRVQVLLGTKISTTSGLFRYILVTFEKQANGVFDKTGYIVLTDLDIESINNYNSIVSDYANTTIMVHSTNYSNQYAKYFAILKLDSLGVWTKVWDNKVGNTAELTYTTNIGIVQLQQSILSADGTFVLIREYSSDRNIDWQKIPLNAGVPDFQNVTKTYKLYIHDDIPNVYNNTAVLPTTRFSADNSVVFLDGYNGRIYQYILNQAEDEYIFYNSFIRSRFALGLSLDGKKLITADSTGWTIYSDQEAINAYSIDSFKDNSLISLIPLDSNTKDALYNDSTIQLVGNNVVFNTAHFDTGAVFNGSDSYIVSSTVPNSWALQEFSISVWLKTTLGGCVVNVDTVNSQSTGEGWAVSINTDSTLKFTHGSGDNSWEYSTSGATNVLDGAWHNLLLTFNGTTGEVKFYLDGVDVHIDTVSPSAISYNNLTNLYLGVYGGGANAISTFFDGMLDHIQMFNRVLASNEVSRLYNSVYLLHITAPESINQSGSAPYTVPIDITFKDAFVLDTDITITTRAAGGTDTTDTVITVPAGVTTLTGIAIEYAGINAGVLTTFDILTSLTGTDVIAKFEVSNT